MWHVGEVLQHSVTILWPYCCAVNEPWTLFLLCSGVTTNTPATQREQPVLISACQLPVCCFSIPGIRRVRSHPRWSTLHAYLFMLNVLECLGNMIVFITNSYHFLWCLCFALPEVRAISLCRKSLQLRGLIIHNPNVDECERVCDVTALSLLKCLPLCINATNTKDTCLILYTFNLM